MGREIKDLQKVRVEITSLSANEDFSPTRGEGKEAMIGFVLLAATLLTGMTGRSSSRLTKWLAR
jgi:hypothetical protein